MNALSSVAVLICTVCAAATMLSLFIPQKRTKKILSFVLGLFLLSSVGKGIADLDVEIPGIPDTAITENPTGYQEEYERAIIQNTADRLVLALDVLLKEKGIEAEDIRLSLKKSADNSISADRIVIYITDAYAQRIEEIEGVVYGNLAKEPEVYVSSE